MKFSPFLDNSHTDNFNEYSHIGLLLPSSRKMGYKYMHFERAREREREREGERERERERERKRERKLAELHIRGLKENPSRYICTCIL